MKKIMIYILIGLAVVVICGGLLMRGSNNPEGEANAKSEATSTENSAAVLIETTPAILGDIILTISETGVTMPVQGVTVSSEVTGTIQNLAVEVGKRLIKNELIARIDDELISLALDQARAQLINASAAFEKNRKDFERYKVLLEKEEISEGEYETASLQHEQARSSFLSAEAAVKTAERQLRNTRVTSPISGRVAVKFVEEGNMISAGQPVVKVVDVSTVKVLVNVSEKDIVQLTKGMPVKVEIDAFPGEDINGKVFSVSPEADASTHTFPVEITVPNNQGPQIRSGMIARVKIQTGTITDATLIPKDAVVERFGNSYVYVDDNGTAKEKLVVLGKESGDMIQVLKGLLPDESVLISGQFNVEDGTPVRKSENGSSN